MSLSTPEFKATLPADFSGDPTDSIRWIKAMRVYFTINSKLDSTNEIKVMTTLNKMSKGRGIDFSEMWYDRTSNTTIDAKEKTFLILWIFIYTPSDVLIMTTYVSVRVLHK